MFFRIRDLAAAIALAAGALGLAAPARAETPWVDTHMHLVGDHTGNFASALAEAVAAMDQAGVRRAIVLPTPQTSEVPRFYDHGDFAASLKRYPGRFAFLGGAALNRLIHDTAPDRVDAALRARFERLAGEVLAAGAAGFGEMGVHHLSVTPGHIYSDAPADHPLFLLLADIAARRNVPIDMHLDGVAEDMPLPQGLAAPPNPRTLRANLAAFERLLAHNRQARIVWAHAGSDQLGHSSPQLAHELLGRHPNLFMSLRLMPGRAPQNHTLTPNMQVQPQWQRVFRAFPDRFTIGTDQFFASPGGPGGRGLGPAAVFAGLSARNRERTLAFLAALPPDLLAPIARDNALRIYNLKP